jgi:hypothetical protein
LRKIGNLSYGTSGAMLKVGGSDCDFVIKYLREIINGELMEKKSLIWGIFLEFGSGESFHGQTNTTKRRIAII